MRVEDGGGFGTIQGNSFAIKQSAVAPISVSGLTASDIEQMFSFLPEGGLVLQSGQAHTAASQVLSQIADALVKHVQVLSENWGGTAAQTAVTNFQQLHETATGLAQASAQTGAVLSWLGQIIPAYKSYTAPEKSTPAGNQAAQAALQQFNENLVEANGNLPSTITKNLPNDTLGKQVSTISAPAGGVAAGAAAAGASPGGAPGGVSPGGAGSTGTPGAPGGTGGTTGVATGTGPSGSPPGTTLAGLPPGGTGSVPGTGTTGTGVPGGAPGGTPGGTPGPDPISPLPVPGGTAPGDPAPSDPGGAPGGVDPGEPAGVPGDGADPLPVGSLPGEGAPGGLSPVPGEGAEPLPAGSLPGGGDPGAPGGVPGDGGDPGGLGGVPGDGADPVPVGSLPGGGGGIGDPVGAGGSSPGGQGLIGEDVVGGSPGDGAVVGPDGMIGTGAGDLGEGMEGGFPEGGVGAGNSGATGFVGADDAIAAPGADSGDGMPMSAAPGSGERDKERRRQAWMSEDADLWQGDAKHVPSHIGA
jgi:uncharacterized protein YukE